MIRRPFLFVAALTILATLAAPSAIAAPPTAVSLTITWHRDLGIGLASVAAGPSGSVYVAGEVANGSFQGKALLAKLSASGAVLWQRRWVPSNKKNPNTHDFWFSARATSVAVADDGAIFVTGFVEKDNCEGGGWFIRKYSPSGTALASFGRFQKTKLQSCTLTPQYTSDIAARGNLVVVAGQDFGCCDDPATDGWVRAFDAGLHPKWNTQFEPPSSIPSTWFDTADGVAIGNGGNVFVGGWAATQPPPTPTSSPNAYQGRGTVVLQELSPTGSVLWARRTDTTMFADSGRVAVAVGGGRIMVSAALGGFYVGWKTHMRTHAWLGSFTLDGAPVWSRSWGLDRNHAAEPTDVAINGSGGTWVVGTQREKRDHGLVVSIRRFGSGGQDLGRRTVGGDFRRFLGGGVAARAGGAYVTGSANPLNGGGEVGRVWRISD
ncbi:MAG TPA: hypothetical protein VK646_13295 [Actinomycetota bacterium]|nr:hypothetical protein [Actinomycetota bacterium]